MPITLCWFQLNTHNFHVQKSNIIDFIWDFYSNYAKDSIASELY